MFSIKNKIILVVGASRGIGLEISKKLTTCQAKVIGIARSNISPEFEYLKVDITKDEEIENLCDFSKKNKLSFDGIVINTAISESPKNSQKLLKNNQNKFKQSPDKFQYINNVNLISIYNLLFNLSPFISKNASIVCISSIGALLGFPGNPAYQTSKAGLNALVRSLSIDLADFDIRVNHLNLGYIKAPMSKVSYDDKEMYKERCDRTILKRWGSIKEVIGPLIFLLSEESSYITGSGINVDGGWLAKGL